MGQKFLFPKHSVPMMKVRMGVRCAQLAGREMTGGILAKAY